MVPHEYSNSVWNSLGTADGGNSRMETDRLATAGLRVARGDKGQGAAASVRSERTGMFLSPRHTKGKVLSQLILCDHVG